MITSDQVGEIAQTGDDKIIDRSVAVEISLLGKLRDTDSGSNPYAAIVRTCFPREQADKGRFSLTVATQQTNAFTTIDLQIDILEKRAVAIGQRSFVEAKQRHE